MVFLCATLLLLHFFLLLLDSPSSGDDEDDDDESEDTGNLFFWDIEAFSFEEMWLPSRAADPGCSPGRTAALSPC